MFQYAVDSKLNVPVSGKSNIAGQDGCIAFCTGEKNSESTKGRKTLRGMDDLATKLECFTKPALCSKMKISSLRSMEIRARL